LVEHEALAQDPRTFKATIAATYGSTSLVEVYCHPATASDCIRDSEPIAPESFVRIMEGYVGKAVKKSFDPKTFLAKVGAGKTILQFHRNQNVFAQGEVADTIFYIQKGRSSSLSCPSKARKRWSGF
jgi:hypothetical protein